MARVLYRGVIREVVVDDFIPCNQLGQPLFAKPTIRYEIWPMILEKCWAKLKGSYAAIIEGTDAEVLRVFSYAAIQHFPFSTG